MSIALLLLSVAAAPPVAVIVKPPELPAVLRERVRELSATPVPTLNFAFTVRADVVFDRSDEPMLRNELSELDCWLRLRPDDGLRRRRAMWLAEALGEQTAIDRHWAAMRRDHMAYAVGIPRSVVHRAELARTLVGVTPPGTAAAVARQATRLDPSSAAAWRTLGMVIGNDGGEWEEGLSAFETAADLAPHDWRVPCNRSECRLKRLAGLPSAVAAAELSACELDRQTAARLGASDPDCLRWSAGMAMALTANHWSNVEPTTTTRRLMDVVLPAVVQMVDQPPTDPRLVAFALMQEIAFRSAAGDLLPTAPDRSTLIDRFPPDAQARVGRWLRRVADTVAGDVGPEAAEKAVSASRLFCMMRQFDRAVAAAERAVQLRPATPYCDEALQNTLLYAGRPADALAQYRAGTAGRSPADNAVFEVGCLQASGRWDEARGAAAAGAVRFPADHGLALAVASCRLYQGTPGAVAVADRRLAEVWQAVADRPADDRIRQQATRLLVIAHLLAGRFTEADVLLDRCRREKQPVRDDTELTAAARPYLWPTGGVVPAAAVVVPLTGRSSTR